MGNRWPGKYVIGLTGNIATGKSVVRKMLEHLGAFGVDADALSHQALARGGPAHASVVKTFGEWLLTSEGEINRAALARIVFSDPAALARLESLLHPIVGQAIDILVKRSKSTVAVVEAIKLIESGLAKECDALWVVNVPEAVQEARLVQKRKMSPAEARQRIAAQPPQGEKMKAAAVVIENSGSFEDTWTQVQAAFNQIAPLVAPAVEAAPKPATAPLAPGVRPIKVRRGKPTDANAIATLIRQVTNGQRSLSRAEIMEAFGDKAYMLADYGEELSGIVGWKVENLVARVDEFYMTPAAPLDRLTPPLIEAVESASRELQSEAALVFVPLPMAQSAAQALAASGYAPQVPEKLGVAAWKEAAHESMPPGTALLFKKLREDRVLKPI
jgi:dephospho-CoA kinase